MGSFRQIFCKFGVSRRVGNDIHGNRSDLGLPARLQGLVAVKVSPRPSESPSIAMSPGSEWMVSQYSAALRLQLLSGWK